MSYGLPVEIYGSESDSDCEKEELNSDCDGDCLRRIEKKELIRSNHKEHLPPPQDSPGRSIQDIPGCFPSYLGTP